MEDPGFHSCDGLVDVTVCADSGLLATEACAADFRAAGSRRQVAADTAPTQSCTMHKMVSYCKDGKHIATASCPASPVMQVAVLDYARETIFDIKVPDDAYRLQVLSEGIAPSTAAQRKTEMKSRQRTRKRNRRKSRSEDLEDEDVFGAWGERRLFAR